MSDQPESLYVSAKEAGIQVRQTPLTPSERKLQVMLDEAGFYESGESANILYGICLKLLDNAEAAPAVPQGEPTEDTTYKLAGEIGYEVAPFDFLFRGKELHQFAAALRAKQEGGNA